MPPSDILKKVREAIYEEPEKYLEIIHNEDFKKTFGEPQGESLKIGPKGFPKDFEHINLIKLKSYTLMFPLSDQEIKNPNLLEHILPVFEKMKAMNSFLNMAVDY